MTTLCEKIVYEGFNSWKCNEPSVGVTEHGTNVCEDCAKEFESYGDKVIYDEEK